jgi:hypothetical protein
MYLIKFKRLLLYLALRNDMLGNKVHKCIFLARSPHSYVRTTYVKLHCLFFKETKFRFPLPMKQVMTIMNENTGSCGGGGGGADGGGGARGNYLVKDGQLCLREKGTCLFSAPFLCLSLFHCKITCELGK